MFGATSVRMRVNLSELQPWAKPDLYKVVAEAVEPEKTENSRVAGHVLSAFFDSHLQQILSSVAKFLGEDPDITGGAMGVRKQPPEWMRLLRLGLMNTFWAHIPFVYMGPLNDKETTLRLLQNYFWHWIQFHD